MEQLPRIVLVDRPEYFACVDQFIMPDGGEMNVIHITIHSFTPSVLKDIRRAFVAFRSCTDAPLFAFEPEPDDVKWERFVSSLGFSYRGVVPIAWDGKPRRFFTSVPHHAREDHTDAEPDVQH